MACQMISPMPEAAARTAAGPGQSCTSRASSMRVRVPMSGRTSPLRTRATVEWATWDTAARPRRGPSPSRLGPITERFCAGQVVGARR